MISGCKHGIDGQVWMWLRHAGGSSQCHPPRQWGKAGHRALGPSMSSMEREKCLSSVHKNLQFGCISQRQLPRIITCDLISKMFSCVTKITLEAKQPHPWPVCSLPSGLMSSDFKGTLTGLLLWCWFFVTVHKHRLWSVAPHTGQVRAASTRPLDITIFVPLVSGSGLVGEWFQES